MTATMTPEVLRERRQHEFELATKLCQLLEIAMADLRLAERSSNCVVNMGAWYARRAGFCTVCLAGAVIRHRLPLPEGRLVTLFPSSFRDVGTVAQRLRALNLLRVGAVPEALEEIGAAATTDEAYRRIPIGAYSGGADWWAGMERLLAWLKERSL